MGEEEGAELQLGCVGEEEGAELLLDGGGCVILILLSCNTELVANETVPCCQPIASSSLLYVALPSLSSHSLLRVETLSVSGMCMWGRT